MDSIQLISSSTFQRNGSGTLLGVYREKDITPRFSWMCYSSPKLASPWKSSWNLSLMLVVISGGSIVVLSGLFMRWRACIVDSPCRLDLRRKTTNIWWRLDLPMWFSHSWHWPATYSGFLAGCPHRCRWTMLLHCLGSSGVQECSVEHCCTVNSDHFALAKSSIVSFFMAAVAYTAFFAGHLAREWGSFLHQVPVVWLVWHLQCICATCIVVSFEPTADCLKVLGGHSLKNWLMFVNWLPLADKFLSFFQVEL